MDNKEYKFVQRGRHDDYGSLIYFCVVQDGKVIKSTSWYDIRDVYEFKEIDQLRQEIINMCGQYGLQPDLSSDDIFDWGQDD